MLIERPTAPATVVDPKLAVPKTSPPSCCCQDKDLDRLRALMARGVPQWDASLLVWSPTVAPGEALALRDPGRWARRAVRAALQARVPWLRLPTPTEVS